MTARNPRAVFLSLVLGVAVFFFVNLAIGSVHIPFAEILRILVGGPAARPTWETIVLLYRLPRAVTAVLAGAALAVAGLKMQTLFRNPLADPFVLGITAGAGLGVALAILVSRTAGGGALLSGLGLFGSLGTVLSASLGAAAVFGLVVLVSRRVESPVTLLVLGLMFGYLATAVVNVLLHFAAAEQVQAYVSWTFGSFAGVEWGQMRALAPAVLAGLVLAHLLVKPLNALLLGDRYARSMGLAVRRSRVAVIAGASLLAGSVTAFCGPIAFLGIAVPHLARGLLRTADHRLLVPAATLLGALVALLADLVAQLPGSDAVLPLNSVTSLVGAPVVVLVILRRRGLGPAPGE